MGIAGAAAQPCVVAMCLEHQDAGESSQPVDVAKTR